MKNNLPKTSYWWTFLLEGLVQLTIGLLLLVSTDITIFLLVQLMGLYWLIRGMIMIIQIFLRKEKDWGLLLFGGVLGIFSGILVLRYPIFSTFILLEFLVVFIAITGIIQGTISVVRGSISKSFGEVLLGIALWVACILLFVNPLSSVMALSVVIGIFWVFTGMVLTAVSFYIRK